MRRDLDGSDGNRSEAVDQIRRPHPSGPVFRVDPVFVAVRENVGGFLPDKEGALAVQDRDLFSSFSAVMTG